jgi:hypothetical protein
LRPEAVDCAVRHRQRDHALASAFLVRDKIDGEILDEELRRVPQRLSIKRVQHGVTGTVGGGARAQCGWSLAELRGHSAEGSLINLAALRPGEGHAVMLELIDCVWRVAAHVLDSVLIAEPIGAFHRVVHVPAPVIGSHVAERGGDAALRCNCMRASREHLREAGGSETRLDASERCSEPRTTGADYDDVVCVIFKWIGSSIDGWPARARVGCTLIHSKAPIVLSWQSF